MAIQDRVNGILTPVGDCNAIVQAICEILEDEHLSSTLSQNAVRINETLNIDKITEEWMDFIHSIV